MLQLPNASYTHNYVSGLWPGDKTQSACSAIGEATSPVIPTPGPLTRVVASWNAETPEHSSVVIRLRALTDRGWTGWFVMGTWAGPGAGSSAGEQSTAQGSVDVDTLLLKAPARACQFQAELSGASDVSPRITLAALCWDNPHAPLPDAPSVIGEWSRSLPVPDLSQMTRSPELADSICSPTSMAMALAYWGIRCDPVEVARCVHDSAADIYGNWPLNTAYAGACGCPSYVARFWCMEQLRQEIALGRPVVASIRFGRGELAGSPLHYSRGHLVVVSGFTPTGDVIVNDPAAPTDASVRRVYQQGQFEKAWIGGSGGIVYLIGPPILKMRQDDKAQPEMGN